VKELLSDEIKPNEIAILARFDHTVDRYLKEFEEQRIQAQKLSASMKSDQPKIYCGTMHNSKGLEFKIVFLVEANEEMIPPEWELESLEDEDDKTELMKLERSLLYVAMTRARDKVYITSFGALTKFLQENPKDDKETDQPKKVQTKESIILSESEIEELIHQVLSCSPDFFEKLVIQLLSKMGYGGSVPDSAFVVGGTGDEGIDGIILEDPLGLHKIYVQAKRWKNSVGRPEIQKFAGALIGKNAEKGVFITTSRFTIPAKKYAEQIPQNMVLIDGTELAKLLNKYNMKIAEIHQ
jgi:restriction endonuclease Mrr